MCVEPSLLGEPDADPTLCLGCAITEYREHIAELKGALEKLEDEANPGPPTIERNGVTLYRTDGGHYVSVPED